jgi:hypothetical protein
MESRACLFVKRYKRRTKVNPDLQDILKKGIRRRIKVQHEVRTVSVQNRVKQIVLVPGADRGYLTMAPGGEFPVPAVHKFIKGFA